MALHIGPNADTLASLESGEADVAVLEVWDGRPGFEVSVWHREPLVIIVPPGHRWAKRQSIAAHELVDEPILGGESGSGTGRRLRAALGPLADRLTLAHSLGSTDAVKHGVAAGLGISIVLQACVRDEITAGRLVGLQITDASITKEFYVATPSDAPASSEARRFVTHLLKNREQLPAS
mgnify:CR=1 FL=1